MRVVVARNKTKMVHVKLRRVCGFLVNKMGKTAHCGLHTVLDPLQAFTERRAGEPPIFCYSITCAFVFLWNSPVNGMIFISTGNFITRLPQVYWF